MEFFSDELFTTPAFAHCTTWSILPHWLKSHMLAPTVLWFVTLKQVIQRSHQQQRQHKSFGSFHFFHFLCSKLVYILSWVWFCLRIISATFLKCETNCSQSDLHTQRDRHTHIYTRGRFNILHMFSMSLMWHLQEHGNLCDWKSRLWLWSRFMTFCSTVSTDYMVGPCNNLSLPHVEQPLFCFGNNSLPTGIFLYS